MAEITSLSPFPMNENGPASAAELADFVFQSFYFSQADIELQDTLLCYGQSYYSDDIAGQPSLESAVSEIVEERCSKRVRGAHTHENISPSDVKTEVSHEVSQLFSVIHGVQPKSPSRFTDNEIAYRTVSRDHRWLIANPGRPNRKPGRNDEYNDPFLSFMVHYGLLGNTTHRPVYDLIFKRVGNAALHLHRVNAQRYIGTGPQTFDTYPAVLRAVVDAHCLHHPEQATAVQALVAARSSS